MYKQAIIKAQNMFLFSLSHATTKFPETGIISYLSISFGGNSQKVKL